MVETKYIDPEKEVLYWIDYFDYKWINCGDLIDYILEMYTKPIERVVEEYVEVMEIKVPSIYILDWDKIVEQDNDYVSLGEGLYLNVYRLEHEEDTLRKEGLIE